MFAGILKFVVQVLVLVFSLLADTAFGDIGAILSAIGLGPRPVAVPVPVAGYGGGGTGLSWRTPLSDGYIGYGR